MREKEKRKEKEEMIGRNETIVQGLGLCDQIKGHRARWYIIQRKEKNIHIE